MRVGLAAIRSVLLCVAGGCTTPTRVGRGPTELPPDAPPGYTVALTGGGPPPTWVVRDDSTAPGPTIVQTSADPTSYRFPLCLRAGQAPADVSATVNVKTLSGTVDQAGGVVVRYRPENYYVARINALEDNVNLFKTVDGNRLKIAEVETKVAPGQWHTLTLTARGPHLTVVYDGKPIIEADDATFAGPGQVGLWTKADSVTAFADLRVEPAVGRR